MDAKPQQEHRWLDRLVGEWTYEADCNMGPDQPTIKIAGSEAVRSIGGLWTVAEGETGIPEGTDQTVMTLGYDPTSGRFVGTFVASMMTHLWIYNGSLDASGKVLELDAEGPSFDGKGIQKYRDSIEFTDDDHRTLTSRSQGDDGRWNVFMTARYTRKK